MNRKLNVVVQKKDSFSIAIVSVSVSKCTTRITLFLELRDPSYRRKKKNDAAVL